jgi:hypothetical protein
MERIEVQTSTLANGILQVPRSGCRPSTNGRAGLMRDRTFELRATGVQDVKCQSGASPPPR